MVNHPNRSVDYPEPAIPEGHKASDWLSWAQVQVAAHLLDVNKNFDMGENFAVHDQLQVKIDAGRAQRWKRGPHQWSPAFYRMIYKKN
jgi:hypothetical protein